MVQRPDRGNNCVVSAEVQGSLVGMFALIPELHTRSGASRHRISLRSQILSQLFFHLRGGLEWHRVVTLVHFGQQTHPILLHDPRRFVTLLVILKPFDWIESGHPNIDARLGWIAPRIGFEDYG